MDEIETKCDEIEGLIGKLSQSPKNWNIIADMRLGLEQIRDAVEDYREAV